MGSFKRITLFLGDIIALYAALIAVLWVRNGDVFATRFAEHVIPFSIVFCAWLLVFYIAGLYDLRRLRNTIEFLKTLWLTLAVNAVLAVLFFYLIPFFGISPRRNLFFVLVLVALILTSWRRLFNRFALSREPAVNVVVIGETETTEELTAFLREHPQLGYRTTTWFEGDSLPPFLKTRGGVRQFMRENKIELVVVPLHIQKNAEFSEIFYTMLVSGVRITDLTQLYETLLRKVPLRDLDEAWFLEHVGDQHRFYDNLKRAAESLFAVLLQIVLVPLELAIAILIRTTSPGPVIYRQVRVGRHGKEFVLYKFRTMRADAERHGPQWAHAHDQRVTPIGTVLRMSHLDELPQLVNIIRGELSFVGPRPERPEFVKDLKEKVPFYEVRHLVKPGVTGWAQIHHPSDKTLDDVFEKLQYDIYYLKNRSFVLDLAILVKTVKTLFVTPR